MCPLHRDVQGTAPLYRGAQRSQEVAMRGLLSILYGVAAYVACVAVLLYFIGFSANLFVPKSVDVGAGAHWVDALGTNLLLLALFGVQHSVMARRGFKRW